jgi:hypothetical protein
MAFCLRALGLGLRGRFVRNQWCLLVNNTKEYIFNGCAMIPLSNGPENIQNDSFSGVAKLL